MHFTRECCDSGVYVDNLSSDSPALELWSVSMQPTDAAKTLSLLEHQHKSQWQSQFSEKNFVPGLQGKLGTWSCYTYVSCTILIVLHILNNLFITTFKWILSYTHFNTVVRYKILSNLLKYTQPLSSRMKMWTHTIYLELLSTK